MRLPGVGIVHDLRGRSGLRFAELLAGHLDATLQGAELARQAVARTLSGAEARASMTEVEHRGDDLRRELVHFLSTTLITPIDREDIYRISRSIDDVLDNLRDFLSEWDLFALEGPSTLAPVLDAVVIAIAELRRAVEVAVANPREITQRAIGAKKAGNEIRRRYEVQLAELFRGELTMEVLKQRELLRRLDVVGLRLGEAANALADAAVKRSEG